MTSTMTSTTIKPKSTAKKKRKIEFNPNYPYYHLAYRALIQGNTIFAVAAPDLKTMEKAGWKEFYLENDEVDCERNEDYTIINDLDGLPYNPSRESVGLSRHDGRSGSVCVAYEEDSEYVRLDKFFTPVQNLADIENQFLAGETGLLFFFEEYDPANKDGLWAEFIRFVKDSEEEMTADPDFDEDDEEEGVNSIQWLLPKTLPVNKVENEIEIENELEDEIELEVEVEVYAYAVVDEKGFFVGCGQTLEDVSILLRDFYAENGTDTLLHIQPQPRKTPKAP